MKIKEIALCFALLLATFSTSNAQIALAVSKNDNGSSVKYSLKVGVTMDEAFASAQKDLEDQEFKNVYILRSTENTGHKSKSGHYVLIIASRKNGGRFFVSYGLGVSEKSSTEAEERAITHLKEWDLGYDKERHGYSIEKQGLVEDLFPSEEE